MNKTIIIVLFCVTLFLCAVALVDVFRLRFDQGDVYPEFSSFRADPMGTRAFYEALENMPGMRVDRNLLDLQTLKLPDDAVLLLAGAVDSPDPEPLIEELEQFMETGGRLIVTLRPTIQNTESEFEGEYEGEGAPWPFGGGDEVKEGEREGEGEGEGEGEKESNHKDLKNLKEEMKKEEEENEAKLERLMGYKMIDITERWGFEVREAEFPEWKAGEVPVYVKLAQQGKDLPDQVAWLSSLYFLADGEEWETVYVRENVLVEEEEDGEEINHGDTGNTGEEGKGEKGESEIKDVPVVLYRSWGKGSLILCSDTYFLSNEAMQRHRYPNFLAWLVSPYQHIIFNETQIGLTQQPGIMDFIRHYRLTGFLIVGIIAGLLFIWKNSVSLVPRRDRSFAQTEMDKQSASDISDGLSALLKRCIPPGNLLGVCIEEYKNTYRGNPKLKSHLDIVFSEEIVDTTLKDTPAVYGKISKRIKERMLGRHE